MRKLLAMEMMFITLMLFLNSGKGIKCYVCRTDEDKGCSKPVNPSYTVECPKKSNDSKTYCRKIHQKAKFLKQKHHIDIRECAYERDKKGHCYHSDWPESYSQITCECTTDFCNRGNNTRFPDILAFVIFLFAWTLITQ